MDESTVIAKLRRRETELEGSGIYLRLFGSKARGDDSPLSDVDLMVDYDRAKKLTPVHRGIRACDEPTGAHSPMSP